MSRVKFRTSRPHSRLIRSDSSSASSAVERRHLVDRPFAGLLELPNHLLSDAQVKRANPRERLVARRWNASEVILPFRAHAPVVAGKRRAASEQRRLPADDWRVLDTGDGGRLDVAVDELRIGNERLQREV